MRVIHRVITMPEENSTSTGDQAGAAYDQQQAQASGKTFNQDDVNRIIADEKRAFQKRERELKAKADAWDKYEQSQKTQEEQLKEKYTNLEKEHLALKSSVELEKARIKAGRKFNIPEADWDRLRGATPEEIEQDAKDWAKSRGLDRAGGPTPKGNNNPARNPFNQAFLDATGRGGR